MVFGEVDVRGCLQVVAVVDDDATAEVILEDGAPIYFSPSLLGIGPGLRSRPVAVADVGGLVALSLTLAPAGLDLRPVGVRRGDVRSSADRAGWPLSWQAEHPLLGRCVEALGIRSRATRLERHADQPPVSGWVDYSGRPVAGPLRHSSGRVLSVR
jgi:hypothetical protein